METQPDFRELLALFNAHHVEYLIVGGYVLAVIRSRFTARHVSPGIWTFL
jgi:hypothetical protein